MLLFVTGGSLSTACVCVRALVASVVRLVEVETCKRNLSECAVCWIK